MQWLGNLALFMLVSGLMLEMIADTKYYKFARFVAGVILLLQFISPITEQEGIRNRFSAVFYNFDFALGSERVLEEIYRVNGQRENTVLEKYKQTIAEQIEQILQKNGLCLIHAELLVKTDGNIQSMQVRAAYLDGSEKKEIVVPTVMPVRIGEQKKQDAVTPVELYIRGVLAEFYQLEENKIEVVIQEAD